MKTRTLAALAAASLLAAGCGPLRSDDKTAAAPDPRIKCQKDHPVCHITVRVKDCRVSVEPDVKHVSYRPGGATMLWTIRDSPGVNFAHNGIAFKPEVLREARKVFTPDERSLASSTLAMHNDTTPGKFPYNVAVIDNGRRCPVHDPSVINEM